MMMKESGGYRVGKYPRYIITLGNSLSSVTVEELATAVGNANAAANAAAASQSAAKTSETNSKASETAANNSKNAAAASQTAAKASETAAKTSETNSKTSENAAKASQTAAKTSETNAATSAQTALDALQGIKDAQDQSPFPDVWLPLNDDMRLLAGIAPYDRIYLGNQYAELPSKSATFTRTTTGTYIDKSGGLQVADINEPRFEKEGLLMENQSTNMYTYSEQWGTGQRVTTTNNSETSPRGDKTMALVIEDTTNSEHYSQDRNITLTAGTIYCYSVFVKAYSTGPRWLYLRVAVGTTAGVFFDPVTGTFAGTSGVGPNYLDRGVDSLSNGVYRIWMTVNAGASQSSVFRLQLANGANNASYTGDGASGIYVWGAQVEESPFPTSYIPTVDSSMATRASDNWYIPSDNVCYKTLVTKFKRTVSFELVVRGCGPLATNYTELIRVSGVTYDIICRLQGNGNLMSYRSSGGIGVPWIRDAQGVYVHRTDGDIYNILFLDKSNSGNNTSVNTNGSAVNIGNTNNSAGKFSYHIRNLRIWNRYLTDNQIKGLK